MVFIRSGRVSGSPVRALRAHRYFTKRWLQRYRAPAWALLLCNLTPLSALLSGAFFSSAAHNSIALSAGFLLFLRSPISEQPPLPVLFLWQGHRSPAAASRSPLHEKSRASKAEAQVPEIQFHNKNISMSPAARRWLIGAKCEAF